MDLTMKRMPVFFALLLFSTLLKAEGWSEGKVQEVRIQPNYHRIFVVQEGAINPDNCIKSEFVTLMIKNTQYWQELYSALLSAHATGRTVSLRLIGCTQHGRPEIKEVWVK